MRDTGLAHGTQPLNRRDPPVIVERQRTAIFQEVVWSVTARGHSLTFITIKDIEPIVDCHQLRASRARAKLIVKVCDHKADLVVMGLRPLEADSRRRRRAARRLIMPSAETSKHRCAYIG
jgi:hypothetical protein